MITFMKKRFTIRDETENFSSFFDYLFVKLLAYSASILSKIYVSCSCP